MNKKIEDLLLEFDELDYIPSKVDLYPHTKAKHWKQSLEKEIANYVQDEKCVAVKEFAEKLKMMAFDKNMFNDWMGATYVVTVQNIDKLLKEQEE